jgi:hypothetical protein
MYEAGGHLWRPGKVQLMAHDAALMVILSDRAAAIRSEKFSALLIMLRGLR